MIGNHLYAPSFWSQFFFFSSAKWNLLCYVPTTMHKMDVTSMSSLQPCWHAYGLNASTLHCSRSFQLISGSVVNAVIGAPSYRQISCVKIETICKSCARQSPEVIEIIEQERCCSHHLHKAIRILVLTNTGQILLLPAICVAGWLVCSRVFEI